MKAPYVLLTVLPMDSVKRLILLQHVVALEPPSSILIYASSYIDEYLRYPYEPANIKVFPIEDELKRLVEAAGVPYNKVGFAPKAGRLTSTVDDVYFMRFVDSVE